MSNTTQTTEQAYATPEHKIRITNEEARNGLDLEIFMDKLLQKMYQIDDDNDTLIEGTISLYKSTKAEPWIIETISDVINTFLDEISEGIMNDRKDLREECDISLEVNVEYLLFNIYKRLLSINIDEVIRLQDILSTNNIHNDIDEYFDEHQE